jgi:hypothetical protein
MAAGVAAKAQHSAMARPSPTRLCAFSHRNMNSPAHIDLQIHPSIYQQDEASRYSHPLESLWIFNASTRAFRQAYKIVMKSAVFASNITAI